MKSVYYAINQENAFAGIAPELKAGVVDELKRLQRVQAISPTPEAIPKMMKLNLTSAYHIAEIPEKAFIKRFGKELDETTAKQIYANAVNNKVRIENALMAMREAVLGSGVEFIDAGKTHTDRMKSMQNAYKKQVKIMRFESREGDDETEYAPLNWETLFGSVDLCECDECNSVYGPASYFVELLQYLRNNNLDPEKTGDPKSIANTPLEMLFRRRQDLGCLELTCKNANIVLPYIDLVNEVMESFVVHLNEYNADTNVPKQATLEAFNITDDILDKTDADALSGELKAQPQNINYKAYCLLKKAVYPFSLPYHQPIDKQRIFLDFLKTSRFELMKTFKTGSSLSGGVEIPAEESSDCSSAVDRDSSDSGPTPGLSDAQKKKLAKIYEDGIEKALDAEYLGLFQEEYIILTRQAYWKKEYFELKCNKTFTEDEYKQKIGLKAIHEYYNYNDEAEMLSSNEIAEHVGLTFVKEQFLKRTGILYTDLVELLKTQFINPNYPKGKTLTILEKIRFSYRFMQSLVNYNSEDRAVRYGKLIEFLKKAQPLIPYIDELLHPDPCKSAAKTDQCAEMKDLEKWVYCCFDKVGKLIVLESDDTLRIVKPPKYNNELVGYLLKNNTIIDPNSKIIGNITAEGKAYDTTGQGFGYYAGVAPLIIKNEQDNIVGYIDRDQLLDPDNEPINYIQIKESCDLTKIRLKHLDGSDLIPDEYDRIHRFIRLWRRVGWSIDELDKAIIGLAGQPSHKSESELPGAEDCFSIFEDDCECPDDTHDCGCPERKAPEIVYDITPDFLQQLAAVKKLLEKTGLELIKLLAFWTDISTRGQRSLYRRLFLTHNLTSIDKVFEADKRGNYLAKSEKITDHKTVLMAALNLKSEDIDTIMSLKAVPDELTIGNVSLIYRCSLLLRLIHVKATDLDGIFKIFGDPFKSAVETWEFFKTWKKMEDADFDIRLLKYIIRGEDDEMKPLTPNEKTRLQLTKTLFDGLYAVNNDHTDITEKKEATSEIIRGKASLIYSQDLVEKIVSLLEGTAIYATSAPKDLVSSNADFEVKTDSNEGLKRKLKYYFAKGAIRVTGILTEAETAAAKAIFTDPNWPKAFDRLAKKPVSLFNKVLAGIMPDLEEAKVELLKGDVIVANNEQDPANTAPEKRYYFITRFLPYLRECLKHRFIVETLSDSLSLEKETTDVLISEILTYGHPEKSLLEIFGSVMDVSPTHPPEWKGYLIPASEGDYTFVVKKDTQPDKFKLDGDELNFTRCDDDDSDIYWLSIQVKLKAGKPYQLEIKGLSSDFIELFWKTGTSEKTSIPASLLLPDYSSQTIKEAYIKLLKISLLVSGFGLKADEIDYLQKQKDYNDFDKLDFDTSPLAFLWWKRLLDYIRLRDSLPPTDTTLIEFFAWAGKTSDNTKLADTIFKLTAWEKEHIEKLIAPEHFNLNKPEEFKNEKNLLKMQKAVYAADKINIDINLLFKWAKPESRFQKCHDVAESIKNAIKARYIQTDWEKVVKPLNDRLRTNQRNALVDYLLVQKPLIEWGVTDENSLYEFFLIDVKMESVMETSRLKQAISSVQLFVQRCMLGLEVNKGKGVPINALDRERWEWMQHNNVWVANRKVFLYPENWIEPELRDDKSPFYKELESELLQKDLNSENVKDALKTYLYKVDEVANMHVVGLFVEKKGEFDNEHNRIHVFSRTHNAPYFFYYRYFEYESEVSAGYWYPWEKVQVDIPSYDVEDADGKLTGNGCYLIPVVWNNRLLIFFPQFMKKTKTNPASGKKFNDLGNSETGINDAKPIEYWEIKMAWSEYKNCKWTQKQISKDAIYDETIPAQSINLFYFIPSYRLVDNQNVVFIEIGSFSGGKYTFLNNGFEFTGNQILILYGGGRINYTDSALPDNFHYNTSTHSIRSLQAINDLESNMTVIEDNDEQVDTPTDNSSSFIIPSITYLFYHPFIIQLVDRITRTKLQEFFNYNIAIDDEAFGRIGDSSFDELKTPYAIYNWELFFHTPALIADKLSKSQQYEEAMKWFHYVFNPIAEGEEEKRYWQFYPFRETDAEDFLEKLFYSLQPNEPDTVNPISQGQIKEWRDNPFMPHVIARKRPSAYMKWVVMKYLDNLINWADSLFRQYTIETINQATQLYILAYHILGPKPQVVPRRGKIKPQTYRSLLDKWDAFGNAMVEMEIIFPYSNQVSVPIGSSDNVVGFANIFGFSSSLYFCIPSNPKLLNYWTIVEDRLFKIRHCLNNEGVFSIPALWDPPIDPALLVQAAAQGLNLGSVLNDLNAPMPNYRFNYLIQKAIELCNELKSMGNALLSAIEKKDAEELSVMRTRHECNMNGLMMEIKKLQLDEANMALEGLQQNRKSPEYRMKHYLQLIGEDANKVPSEDADFTELPNQIETPVDESGLKLIKYEKEEMDKAEEAHGYQKAVGIL